ncbi:MAG: potassium transporter TrkG, partial [Lacipirellulaceae bacterium]
MSHPFRNWNPLKVLLLGYASYMAIGWIALCLPLCHEAEDVPAIDHLFTAISAVSTTGLATVSTPATYSFYGELVILVLIQLGGIGYMTLGSFILLARKRKLTPERAEIAKLTFALPEGFQLRGFLRNVVLFTLIIESLGAVSLYFEFRSAGVEDCLWQAIFHAVSAFCTAGFSLFPDSLMGFA